MASKDPLEAGERLQILFWRWRLTKISAVEVARIINETPIEKSHYPRPQSVVFRLLGKSWAPRDRQLLMAVVKDRGFSRLDGWAVYDLALVINGVEKRKVVELDELHGYPEYAEDREKQIAGWRAALRAHLLKE